MLSSLMHTPSREEMAANLDLIAERLDEAVGHLKRIAFLLENLTGLSVSVEDVKE